MMITKDKDKQKALDAARATIVKEHGKGASTRWTSGGGRDPSAT